MVSDLLKVMAMEKKKEQKENKPDNHINDEISTTHHVVTINGKPIRYKASTGYMQMQDETGKLKTRIFFISYEKENVEDKGKRPITFAFNGGPGASSAWVHFGAMGPKRVNSTDQGESFPPPYSFVDNELSWLDFTDLVFIDPVGTGYSRPEKDEDPKQFYGVEEDFKWGGDFIRLYITRNNRWLSPKYLAGESYGTFRAVGLVKHLQNHYAMDLNGIVFISSALNYQTFDFSHGNDLPYLLFLPAYTAAAWYHKKLAPELLGDLEKTLQEVEDFVANEYSVALFKGDELDEKTKEEILNKLSYYTGLSREYIDDNDLRVPRHRFMRQLLRKDKLVLGMYDSRFTCADMDPAGDNPKIEASKFMLFGSYIACLNEYLRKELKYKNDLAYLPISRQVSSQWNWSSGLPGGMGYASVTETLLESITYNKYLKVFFACGYYDLCTPYSIARYLSKHTGLHGSLRQNIILKNYEAGHMMYVNKPSRLQLFNDMKEFMSVE
ncbi:MAG: peptidase S10 [Firmicutes bacterium]|nr:peptidase S10 [Bacillota bacterium]